MNPTFKHTKAFNILKVKFEEGQIAKIADALFLVYHPMSDFFELSVREKKEIAIEKILGDIEWESFSEVEDDYKQLVLPKEKSMYIHMASLLDWTYEHIAKIREQRVGKLQFNITKDLLKEITVFATKFSTLKDNLQSERAKAKKIIDKKAFGNVTLSSSDERFSN